MDTRKFLIAISAFLLSGCSLLGNQGNRIDDQITKTGDNANISHNYISGMTNEQLVLIGVASIVLAIIVGFMSNIAVRYSINRYGVTRTAVFAGIGLGMVSSAGILVGIFV
jgi:hypothetical protein